MVLVGLLRPALPITSTYPLLCRLAAVRHRSWVAAAGMAGLTVTASATAHIGGFLSKKPYAPASWASHLFSMPSHTISLGHFPAPIHKWNLPNLPEGTEVWIKRDNLSGMPLSGNKVRKLEFLMADAMAQGADCIITVGGIQSNHCRATAVAAKYLNLDCYLILYELLSYLWTRTLVWLAIYSLRDWWGHTLILCQKKSMEELAAWL